MGYVVPGLVEDGAWMLWDIIMSSSRHRPPRINDRHIHDSLIRQLLGNHEPTKRDSTTHYT